MRRYLLPTLLFASLPLAAHAQNYIPANGYNGAGIVVNMDVLSSSGSSARPDQVMSQDLAPPIQLRKPVPQSSMQQRPAPAYVAPGLARPIEPVNTPILDDNNVSPALPSPIQSLDRTSGDNAGRQELGSVHAPSDDNLSGMPAPAPKMMQSDEMSPMTAPPEMPSSAPAAMSSNISSSNFEAYRLFFDPSSDVLKPSETAVLDKIIGKLNSDQSLRLQVRAYAAGTADNAGAARRLSLSRSLKVRDYLMQKNITATRLDIRALGTGSMEMGDAAGMNKAPPDRVDVIFSK